MKTKVSLVHIIIITLIVAILTAIIVPVVVNVNNNSDANAVAETSDEMTVDHLNEALEADEEINGKPETLCAVWEILEAAGYNSGAAPLYNENSFIYYSAVNRVMLVTNNVIVYPSAYSTGTIYTNFSGSAYIDFNTLATDAAAHDSNYANGGTCGVCGATNAD